MKENVKVECLVVDTSAFIKNAPLQDIGTNIITAQDVIDEITSKRQLRRLVVLPYDLVIKDVFPENVQFEFAKKTGDYISLSATDIKVIALTYQLEKEKVGSEHLKDVPAIARTVKIGKGSADEYPKNLAGFYLPKKGEDSEGEEDGDNEESISEEENDEQTQTNETNKLKTESRSRLSSKESSHFSDTSSDSASESDYETATSDPENNDAKDLAKRFAALKCKPEDLEVGIGNEHSVDDILVPVRTDSQEGEADEEDYEEDEEDEDDEEQDDGGWITPGNIMSVKKKMDSDILEEKPAKVACLTMDFAMQNVLKQIGLNLASLDGRVIKQLRTFILRCYACFKTTSVMTKMFCPNCGNKTLKKVAVSLDENGKQQIHINSRKPLTPRGKKYSLPTPQGGKHANNPLLYEDQPRPDQKPTRLARTKNDPLNDDYIAGYSPFVMRDVNSKSAILGIRSGADVKHWMRKNPNEVRRKRK